MKNEKTDDRDKQVKREGVHWAARPLPPPPINHRKKAPGPDRPADRRDGKTDEWIKDLKVQNTEDAG